MPFGTRGAIAFAPDFAGANFCAGLVFGTSAGGFLAVLAFVVAFAFGGGPFGSGGLADPGDLALGLAEDEASLLAGALGGGAFGGGRALALACSAANPDRRKVSHAAASSSLMFAVSNGDPPNPAA